APPRRPGPGRPRRPPGTSAPDHRGGRAPPGRVWTTARTDDQHLPLGRRCPAGPGVAGPVEDRRRSRRRARRVPDRRARLRTARGARHRRGGGPGRVPGLGPGGDAAHRLV
ncbi:MAG: hypothetical protein AVDCRST_MAG53-2328, partial [uncultured Solirubrobacteraceae bacterium]